MSDDPFITLPYDDGTVTIRLDHIDMMTIKPSKYNTPECGLQIWAGRAYPTINYKSRARAEEVMRGIQELVRDQQGGAQDV